MKPMFAVVLSIALTLAGLVPDTAYGASSTTPATKPSTKPAAATAGPPARIANRPAGSKKKKRR